MTLQEFHAYQEQTFDSYCKTVIKRESIKTKMERARRAGLEIGLSELPDYELQKLSCEDVYDLERASFFVGDTLVTVRDHTLAQALATLPPHRRAVILLSYFLGKSDTEIGSILHLAPSTVRYRRSTTLPRLRAAVEALERGT